MRHNIRRPALALSAAALTALGTGHVASPLAAVLSVFIWLRFWNHTRWSLGLPVFTVLHGVAWELAYLGTVPLPSMARWPMFLGFSLVYGLVFLVHVSAMRRWNNVLASVALPCGFVIIELMSATFSPTGSWGSLSYTFLEWLPVAQIASVLGWVGITFFAVWVAALADFVVHNGIRTRSAIFGTATAIVLIATVTGFGYSRLASRPTVQQEARVALMHGPTIQENAGGEILRAHYLGWGMDDTQRAQQPALAAAYRQRMFEETMNARGDADLIVWSEALTWMCYDEEALWIEEGQNFCRDNSVMLLMAVSVFDPTRERLYLNKSILIDAQGEIAWEFLKARPVPGAWHVVGDGVLPAVDTELGRIGGAICYDMDFPSLLRQAGRSGTQLFLAPSSDDKAVRWMHVRMAIMRAIEQGFTLVRPTAFGVSVVGDPFGRRLVEKDAFARGGFVMQATVPMMSVSTVYSRVGDMFAWMCTVIFFAIVVTRMARTR